VLGSETAQAVKSAQEEEAIRRPHQMARDPICGNERQVEDRLPLDRSLAAAQRRHHRCSDRNRRGAERPEPTPARDIPDRRDGDRAARISLCVASRRHQDAEKGVPAGSRRDRDQTLFAIRTSSHRRQGKGGRNVLVPKLLQRRDRERLRLGDPLQPLGVDGGAPLLGLPSPAPETPSHACLPAPPVPERGRRSRSR
jgi:hypothetical protein